MDQDELLALKAQCAELWPGPWMWDDEGYLFSLTTETDVPFEMIQDFIIQARLYMPMLIEEVERLSAENALLTATLKELMQEGKADADRSTNGNG